MDPSDLDRFEAAQAGAFDTALAEIRRGRKRTHWMWFVFPQLRGLGHSSMAERYGIGSLAEARAYLDHRLLGSRMRTIVEALQDLVGSTAQEVFGELDAMKLRSSLTLFLEASGDPLFAAALDRWFNGVRDEATLKLLEASN